MIQPDLAVREAGAGDAAAIARIYNHYVETTSISMETAAVSGDEMAARIAAVRCAGLPWLVLLDGGEIDGEIAGYAHATQWRARPGYRHAVEASVYLAPGRRGRGWGAHLYRALLARLVGHCHSVIGGIALPNPASVALHEHLGFRQVACFSQVGRKFGEWVDVAYWQLLLPMDV